MGCESSKGDPKSLEIIEPCSDLLEKVIENLVSSRDNIKLLEPTFYFLNICLEQSTKKSSQQFSKAFQQFYPVATTMLNNNAVEESSFLKSLNPLLSAFKTSFPDIIFDFNTRMKFSESISNNLSSEFLQDFFLNDPAQFWNKAFGNKASIDWDTFYDKFKETYRNPFQKEIAAFSSQKEQIENNILILMKDFLQTDNDHKVTRRGWNVFCFKKLADFRSKTKFVEAAAKVPTNVKENKLLLKYIYCNDEMLDKPVEYHISGNGLNLNTYDQSSKPKNMEKDFIRVGRNDENDIRLTQPEVSRYHFNISSKKRLAGNSIIDEFYVNNVSDNYIYFVVEEAGYCLLPNNLIYVTDAKQFTIKDMYPPPEPNNNFFSVDAEYNEDKRKLSKKITSEKKPFIEIKFVDEELTKKFEVVSGNEDFSVSIGSAEEDDLVIHDEYQGEDYVYPSHCYLKFDSAKKCWLIQDRNVTQPNVGVIYKTLVRCCNSSQYPSLDGVTVKVDQNTKKMIDATKEHMMRGIKLVSGMKIYVSNNVLSVEILDS